LLCKVLAGKTSSQELRANYQKRFLGTLSVQVPS
jgi:hypothetical protein